MRKRVMVFGLMSER